MEFRKAGWKTRLKRFALAADSWLDAGLWGAGRRAGEIHERIRSFADRLTVTGGKRIAAGDIDLLARALSMGKLHHAMMGTASVAIATAAAVPGTLVNLAAGGGQRDQVNFGHPSGTLRVGAQAQLIDGEWTVTKAIMSRSARVLMEGRVHVPQSGF